MPPEITVDFINRSTDVGNSEVVLFETAEGPPRHTLRFQNLSGRTQTFVCYQPMGHNFENGYSVAWFAMPVASGVQVNFRWQPTFDLVWMETGKLAPGIQAMASQVIPASLGSSNMAHLSYIDEAFAFHNQGPGEPPTDLIIRTDGTIPQYTVSVGIGMAGAPTQVIQTQANLNTVFTAVPNYWVAIADVVQGEVLDEAELAPKAPVVFPLNVTAMTATLDADQKFVVQQGLVV